MVVLAGAAGWGVPPEVGEGCGLVPEDPFDVLDVLSAERLAPGPMLLKRV
jgi:hypothetical protein